RRGDIADREAALAKWSRPLLGRIPLAAKARFGSAFRVWSRSEAAYPTTSGPYGRSRRKKLQAEVGRTSCPVSVEEARFLGEAGFLRRQAISLSSIRIARLSRPAIIESRGSASH